MIVVKAILVMVLLDCWLLVVAVLVGMMVMLVVVVVVLVFMVVAFKKMRLAAKRELS